MVVGMPTPCSMRSNSCIERAYTHAVKRYPMKEQSRTRLNYLLLLVPFVGLLCVPLYDTDAPEVAGIPFFYWYQLVWIPVTVFLTWIVYRRVRHDD
jgi:Protein of unknown function (DUF3311)